MELTPENKEIAAKFPPFQYVFGMSLDNGAERQYTSTYQNVTIRRCLWTPKNRKSGNWGKGKVVYVIDGEKKEYKDINELLNVVRERLSLKKVEL